MGRCASQLDVAPRDFENQQAIKATQKRERATSGTPEVGGVKVAAAPKPPNAPLVNNVP